jgi:hypothetical protein
MPLVNCSIAYGVSSGMTSAGSDGDATSGNPVGREVVTQRRIYIIDTAWNEAPQAHAINNTLAMFEDAYAHP